MRRHVIRVIILSIVLCIGFGCSSAPRGGVQVTDIQATLARPPQAEKIPTPLTTLGHTRIDNYYWMNQRENPKVIAYLTAENNYLKYMMKHTVKLQDELYNEMINRIQQEDTSVPYPRNGYNYYVRYEKGKEYPIYCRKQNVPQGKEEILLDVNQMARGHEFFRVSGDFDISPDNTIIAYGVDTVSRRLFTLYFKNLRTGQILTDTIPGTSGSPIWAKDNKTIFYISKDPQTLRECKVYSHQLGTPATQDREVYVETDETFSVDLSKAKSGAYIFIRSFSTLSSECRYLDAAHPEGQLQLIEPREKDILYEVEHYKDKWIIRTNYQAVNFKLVEAPIEQSSKANWKDIVPHRDDVFFEDYEVFADYLVVEERQNGLLHLRVICWDNQKEDSLPFSQPTYSVAISGNQEFNTPLFRYRFTSLATPNSTYQYNMNSKETVLLKQERIGGGFSTANYQTERLWATAYDGTPVPISLVYRKGLKKDGNNPLLLEAYGSYGSNFEVDFRSERLALLDRGFVYAIPHIRGGQEMGRYWYENGKLCKKKNTFTDYIDCGQYLIKEKYTCPEKLFALGGSAGGLLMGAVVNMNPTLFNAVVAEVPFVDVVTTMLDKSIPLTTSEFDEWGDPSKKEYYDYMLSYSPYDNVEAKNYPAILVTAGLHDSQVQYWEPAKWVAKLREMKTGQNLLLLHTNMAGGHDGASGRFQQFRDTAFIYTFMLDQLQKRAH